MAKGIRISSWEPAGSTTSRATGPAVHPVYIIDPAHFDWGGGGDIEEGAADQVADVDFVGIERGALGERDGDDQAGQSFGVGDGTGLGKVEDDAALMKPVGLKLENSRGA